MGAFASALVLGKSTLLFAALFFASIVAVAAMWRKGIRRVASFFVGARGEERVANVLVSLPQSYHVFHDFVAGGSPVDHVVVGPTGVFAVETKNWRGKVGLEDGHVLVDGRLADRSPLQQAIREADAVRTELEKAGWTGTVMPVLPRVILFIISLLYACFFYLTPFSSCLHGFYGKAVRSFFSSRVISRSATISNPSLRNSWMAGLSLAMSS
jgi:hypothetical protein